VRIRDGRAYVLEIECVLEEGVRELARFQEDGVRPASALGRRPRDGSRPSTKTTIDGEDCKFENQFQAQI
jgi:hypothetical protein